MSEEKYVEMLEDGTLYDYITNLQEENEYNDFCNEKLRKKITNLEYKITTYENHKSRNEKAVEYIKNENICREELPKYARIEINNFDKKYRNDLLNILQGGGE